MITIPVLIGFDSTQPIGALTLDETKLSPGVGYVFALGYSPTEFDGDPMRDFNIKKADLMCVSVQSDEQYLAYLNSKGFDRGDDPYGTALKESHNGN